MRLSLERDSAGQYAAAFLFSVSLGIASVAYPLFVLSQGQSGTVAGLLLALSAAVQVATRWSLGAVMRVVSNATVITAAAALMAFANAILIVSGNMTTLIASSVIQGIARACFWTGNQVHIVRSERSTSSGIATLNMMATLAMLVGPVIGGAIAENSFEAAFAVAALIALVGTAAAFLLDRPPPFARVGGHGYRQLLKHPGVRLGVCASVTVGFWRGLLASYVPIGLDAAGSSEATIGVVVAIANGAAIVGGFLATRVGEADVTTATAVWTAITVGSTAIIGYELHPSVITLALVAGGVAVGLIQVLAITAVSESVRPEHHGDAVTLAGVARGITLSGAPLVVATLLLVVPLGPATLIATAVLGGPTAVYSARLARRPADSAVA